MRITRLELRDFRNCEHRVVQPNAALTVFVGPNASGKTNLMEAICVVATGSSFRRPRWDEVVRWGASEAAIGMQAEGESAPTDVRVRIDATGNRSWSVNGRVRRRAADATRIVPTISFTPDDLALVKGPAEQRRAGLDSLGEQLSVTYAALRRDYSRVVRHRNTLLKEGAPAESLAPWDEQLVVLGARLYVHRRRLASRIAQAASPIYARLAGGEGLGLGMEDRCGVGCAELAVGVDRDQAEEGIRNEIENRRTDERARGISLVGPHRDDIVFTIDGRNARSTASQGQQRTITLAWKLAEVEVVREVLRRAPVLLLDDVMSELDEVRRGALTDLVQQDIQTFITTTNTGYFDPDLLRSALVLPVGEGA